MLQNWIRWRVIRNSAEAVPAAGNRRAEESATPPNPENSVKKKTTARENRAEDRSMTFPMQRSRHSDLTTQEIADRLAIRELVDVAP
jgi:hypothetical protein